MSRPGRRKKSVVPNFIIDLKTRKAALRRLRAEAIADSREMTSMFNLLFRSGRPEGYFCGKCQISMVEIPQSEFTDFAKNFEDTQNVALSDGPHCMSGFVEMPVETVFGVSPEPQPGPSWEPQPGPSWEPQPVFSVKREPVDTLECPKIKVKKLELSLKISDVQSIPNDTFGCQKWYKLPENSSEEEDPLKLKFCVCGKCDM